MSRQWLKPALLGVQQPVVLDAYEGELGALLARVSAIDDAALGFSRSVGVLAACALAAVTPQHAATDAPVAAPHDARQLAPDDIWMQALHDAFASATVMQNFELRLQHEACLRLAARDATLPANLLPAALDAGQRSTVLRPALLPVLGARGRWLAERNPDWKFAAGGSEAAGGANAWSDGAHLDRLAWFRELRAKDAAAAHTLLAAGLGDLPAKERLDFVEVLEVNLDAADEVLLEPLLKDRGKEVRVAAALLLARLPASAHAQRLVGWLAPLMRHEKKFLGSRWTLEAPEAADPAWAAAGIETKRPQHDPLGERAWWLYQLVRQVPLRWWNTHTGMSAADLLAWARKSDWKLALHRGWRERAGAGDGDWIDAMLGDDSRELQGHSTALLALLPTSARERHWPADFDALCDKSLILHLVGAFAPGETLSLEFSRGLIPSLARFFANERARNDYSSRTRVLELATLLHPASLRGAQPVPRVLDETPAMADCALAFDRIIRVRATLATLP